MVTVHLSFRQSAPAQAGAATDDGPWAQIDLGGTLAEATRRVVAEVERRKVEQAIKEAGGNRARAAEILAVSYKALLGKLKDYNLEG